VSPKAIGNANEKMLDLLCRVENIVSIEIPDGCKRVGKYRIIPVKSPFDRILAKRGKSAFVDYKHSSGKAFTYSMVDKDQVNNLITLESVGLPAGYLVFFSQYNKIIFFKASKLFEMIPRDSLSWKDGVDCGSQLKSNIKNILNAGN